MNLGGPPFSCYFVYIVVFGMRAGQRNSVSKFHNNSLLSKLEALYFLQLLQFEVQSDHTSRKKVYGTCTLKPSHNPFKAWMEFSKIFKLDMEQTNEKDNLGYSFCQLCLLFPQLFIRWFSPSVLLQVSLLKNY